MELIDLKLLAAASLLAGSVHASSSNTRKIVVPSFEEMEAAVRCAQLLWHQVIKQDREG
jgi:hypothetical protein